RLAEEALRDRRVELDVVAQQLDRDGGAGELVTRPQHDAHAALPQHRLDGVAAVDDLPGPLGHDVAARNEPSRSACRSARSSMPTDSRMKPSTMPSAARRSAGTLACVMIAGCSISDSTPPSDSAS